MDKRLHQFFSSAKTYSLSAEEKMAVRTALASKTLQLSANEKQSIRSKLVAHMEEHPIEESHSVFAVFHSFFSLRFASLAIVFVLLTSLTGGVAYAAEDTVPGDLLYPVKVDITEPLRERFIRDPEKREEWIVKRMDRRLEEARVLSQRPDVPEELIETLQQRIDRHAQRLEAKLQELQDAGDPRAERFEQHMQQKIAKHEQVLSHIEEHGTPPPHMKRLLKSVRGRHSSIRKKMSRFTSRNPDQKKVPTAPRVPREVRNFNTNVIQSPNSSAEVHGIQRSPHRDGRRVDRRKVLQELRPTNGIRGVDRRNNSGTRPVGARKPRQSHAPRPFGARNLLPHAPRGSTHGPERTR